MDMSELDYELPEAAIATRPTEPRDRSRLMVVRRDGAEGAVHRHFWEMGAYLRAGDLLVVNDTRVLPAKLSLRRASGAAIPGLFVREVPGAGDGDEPLWDVMLRTRGKVKEGEELISGPCRLLLERRLGEGMWRVRVRGVGKSPAAEILAAIGAVPLPPYIERRRQTQGQANGARDVEWYQTVYARGSSAGGSVAAPTAGLHFTPELLEKLRHAGVKVARVELQVGLGTFLPVETATLEEHRMHAEWFRVPRETVEAIRATRGKGRVVAVGTTVVRTLESVGKAIVDASHEPSELQGETTLKIGPGFSFQVVDALLTNFHLPRSTLMALVAAFLGKNGAARLKDLYAVAIREGYRFYSYGDAMLIQ